jgi:hypothetical protein
MKTSLQHLRRFIRESLIQEMAFGGRVGQVVNLQKHPDPKGHLKALQKYHGAKGFKIKATAILKNLGPEIWIIPDFDPTLGGINRTRTSVLSWDDALPYIIESGIGLPEGTPPTPDNEQENLSNAKKHLDKGGSIIISSSTIMEEGFWPSPWNILHAIADDAIRHDTTHPLHRTFLTRNIDPLKTWDISTGDELEDLFPDLWTAFLHLRTTTMTMGSARNSRLDPESPGDVYAESFVQSVSSPQGFHLDTDKFDPQIIAYQTGTPKPKRTHVDLIKRKLLEYEGLVNGLRGDAITAVGDLLRSNVTFIKTVDLPYEGGKNFNK